MVRKRYVPTEPTTVTVEQRDQTGTVEKTFSVPLIEIRDGFAFTGERVPYCLEDGAKYCFAEGGVFLSVESLARCQEWEKQAS